MFGIVPDLVTNNPIIMEMDFDDFVKVKMTEKDGKGWGLTAAVYLVVGIIAIALLAYLGYKGCDEKAQLTAGVASLAGRVNAIEPALTAQGNNLYQINGVLASTVQGVKDIKQCFGEDIYQLNEEVFYNRRRGSSCGGGCGNREFRQSSTYNLASTQVTVDETCRN